MENYKSYPYDSAWDTAFSFLDTITPSAVETEYEILGDAVYAIIASYNTREPHRFEAHREYVDIQCLLGGQKIIESTSLNRLTVGTPYDPENDIAFYVNTDSRKAISHLVSGVFVAFFYMMPTCQVLRLLFPVSALAFCIRSPICKVNLSFH